MAISDEVALILKGQNVASPAIDEVVKSLRSFRTILVSTTGAIEKYNAAAEIMVNRTRALVGPQNDLRYVMETTTRAAQAQTVAFRELGAAARDAGRGGRGGGGGGTPTGGSGGSSSGRGGFGFGSQLSQLAVYGGGYALYSGIKSSVGQAIDFNATTASTQATTGISAAGLKQVTDGILQIAGSGKSRYDANQLLQGAYAIISTGVTNPQEILAQLHVATASATGANAPDVLSSTNALTTVMNAYGMSSGAMRAMDVITMAINQGKADPTQIPGAFATFARSAHTAGVSLSDAGGAFGYDTLASRDAQISGQNLNALMQFLTGPDKQSRTLAKMIPGLADWGPGMVQRAGGLGPWTQNLLASIAGSHSGQLLQTLIPEQNAREVIQGAMADPAKFQQYLRNAPGTGSTQRGADVFLGSDAGKLYTATNELKTQFQKFSDSAIPLLTQAVQGATAGILALQAAGSSIDKLSAMLNLPGKANDAKSWLDQHIPGGAGTALAAAIPGGLIVAGVKGLYDHTLGGSGSGNAMSQLAGAPGALGTLFFGGSAGSRTAPTGHTTRGGGAEFTTRDFEAWQVRGAGAMPTAPAYRSVAGAGSGDVPGASPSATAAHDAGLGNAVSFVSRTGVVKKTGDMSSAQAAFNFALGSGASLAVIHQAEQNLEAAIRDSPLDDNSKAYARFQAQQMEANYRQNLAATAASNAANATQAGYAHVQAVLSNAQFSGTGVSAATQGEISFLRAHPTLWGGDPAILQSMINGISGAASPALPKAITEQLIRPTLPSDELSANFGASVARLTGGPDQAGNATIRELQKENASLREQIAVLQGVSRNTKKTAETNEVIARGVSALVSQGGKPDARDGSLRNTPGARR